MRRGAAATTGTSSSPPCRGAGARRGSITRGVDPDPHLSPPHSRFQTQRSDFFSNHKISMSRRLLNSSGSNVHPPHSFTTYRRTDRLSGRTPTSTWMGPPPHPGYAARFTGFAAWYPYLFVCPRGGRKTHNVYPTLDPFQSVSLGFLYPCIVDLANNPLSVSRSSPPLPVGCFFKITASLPPLNAVQTAGGGGLQRMLVHG